MSNIWIYLISWVCPAVRLVGHPSVLCGKNFDTDLDLACVSQSQRKTKAIGFIFLHTFQLFWIKFAVEAIQAEHPDTDVK